MLLASSRGEPRQLAGGPSGTSEKLAAATLITLMGLASLTMLALLPCGGHPRPDRASPSRTDAIRVSRGAAENGKLEQGAVR